LGGDFGLSYRNRPPTFDQSIETRSFLEDLLGCKVDLVTLDGLKPLARVEVEKDAIYVSTSHDNSSPT
jgi:predicted nucleotidyltransferase